MTALSKTGFSVDVLQGYLAGLTLSTAGSSATFGVAAGVAADSTALAMMRLPSAFTKTTSAWSLGTAGGSLDTGAIANNTWYHAYLIMRPDTGLTDITISLNATTPALPTNYTLYRRIGSVLTNGSAQWVLFIQNGNTFEWSVPVTDVAAANPGTAAVLRTLSAPLGVITEAILQIIWVGSSASDIPAGIYISNPAVADTASTLSGAVATVGFYTTGTLPNPAMAGSTRCFTNTSSQVRSRVQISGAGIILYMSTIGWVDRRGQG